MLSGTGVVDRIEVVDEKEVVDEEEVVDGVEVVDRAEVADPVYETSYDAMTPSDWRNMPRSSAQQFGSSSQQVLPSVQLTARGRA